jgi:hypothetical protein
VRSTPLDPPTRPQTYYIPAVWVEVIDTLAAHGIPLEVMEEEETVDVIHYRMADLTYGLREGRATASAGNWTQEECTRTYRPGDVRVKTDHPLGTLAVALLEPRGEASLFYYGFFNSVFSQNEYAENYIMLPIAERLVEDYPDTIGADWDAYVSENPDYGESDVVNFFFPYTEFWDTEAYVYPVGVVYGGDDDDDDDDDDDGEANAVVPTTVVPTQSDVPAPTPDDDAGTPSPTEAAPISAAPPRAGQIRFARTLVGGCGGSDGMGIVLIGLMVASMIVAPFC